MAGAVAEREYAVRVDLTVRAVIVVAVRDAKIPLPVTFVVLGLVVSVAIAGRFGFRERHSLT